MSFIEFREEESDNGSYNVPGAGSSDNHIHMNRYSAPVSGSLTEEESKVV